MFKGIRFLSSVNHKKQQLGGFKTQSDGIPSLPQSQWQELKQTAHQYGNFFNIYNSLLWVSSGILSIAAVELLASDVVESLVKSIDVVTINPSFAKMVTGLLVNEALEPIRFPMAVKTVPFWHNLFSKK